jgi:uncharacterized protein DUF2690
MRKLMSAAVLVVAVCAAVIGTSAFTAPAPAAATAAASCYASSCSGKNPDSTGCSSDARTIYRAPTSPIAYPHVELRYSPTCRAAWARAVDAETGVEFWVYNRGNGQQQISYYYGPGSYTNMVNDAGTTSHACFYLFGNKQCTPYY